jgi:hypothetical protein
MFFMTRLTKSVSPGYTILALLFGRMGHLLRFAKEVSFEIWNGSRMRGRFDRITAKNGAPRDFIKWRLKKVRSSPWHRAAADASASASASISAVHACLLFTHAPRPLELGR